MQNVVDVFFLFDDDFFVIVQCFHLLIKKCQ